MGPRTVYVDYREHLRSGLGYDPPRKRLENSDLTEKGFHEACLEIQCSRTPFTMFTKRKFCKSRPKNYSIERRFLIFVRQTNVLMFMDHLWLPVTQAQTRISLNHCTLTRAKKLHK